MIQQSRRVGSASRGAIAIAVIASALLGGCSLFRSPSQVALGRLYTTGDNTYDQFFAELHAFHEDAVKAQDDTAKARAPLAKALHVDEKADAEVSLQAAEGSAKKLKDASVLLHLQLTPETKLLAVHGSSPIAADGEALIQGVEESARSCLDVSQKLGALQDKVAELEKKRADLRARASTELHEVAPVKREEIARELDASKNVLADDGERVALYAGSASKFVLDLARAVETGGAKAAPPAEVVAAPKVKPRPKWMGPANPAKTGAAVSAPAKPAAAAPAKPAVAAPAPKKHGGDDFEP